MKRENVRLYREGRWTFDDRMIVESVLPTEAIPLMVAGVDGSHDGSLVMGEVNDVHRGRWGWVLGSLMSWSSDTVDPDFTGFYCEADFDQVVLSYKTHWLRARPTFSEARLRAVTVGCKPCWRGMKIR